MNALTRYSPCRKRWRKNEPPPDRHLDFSFAPLKISSRQHPPDRASTWIDLLGQHALTRPEKPALIFHTTGEETTTQLTYGDLDRRARAIAAALREHCAPGDRALLTYPSGLDFLSAFFGCLYAGVVAVPAYPPRANESIHYFVNDDSQ